MSNVSTLKGFRDFLPKELRKRSFVINALRKVFESYGFEPLETPALEYEEILMGKYGDEGDKLMYKFEDNGKRKVALRYDQTVPLARVVAQYQNELSFPFKRYQIQNVWRAENTQKGRFREFLQVDIDTIGSSSPLADLEILQIVYDSFKKLGIKVKIKINDRRLLKSLTSKEIIILDKLNKIGDQGVVSELKEIGKNEGEARKILDSTKALNLSEELKDIKTQFEKINPEKDILIFEPTLARGISYYTGIIFEVEVEGYDGGSIAGGGRYDNLIGTFAGKDIPAVGFSFGFDRLMEAMEQQGLFPKSLSANSVLVAFYSSELQEKALETAKNLRKKDINAEFYLDDASLEKQLKYADKKQIPYVLIVEKDKLNLKDMNSGNQQEVTIEDIPNKIA